MHKLSAIILTKNSENLIADCIESVSFCDEIIVIDDASSDRTVDLATRLSARVETPDSSSKNFSEKRNFGLKKAKNKWILYIDADERVTRELKESVLKVINDPQSEYHAYKILRKNFYLGSHEWPFIESLERLFMRYSLKGWSGEVHETPLFDGKIGELSGFLLHYTHTDLTSMVNKTLVWSQIEAELRFKAHHPAMTWWRFPRVMLTAFYDSYFRQKGYKAGTAGLIESIYQAFSIFITYVRLWEMQQKKNNAK
ncbi:glycosyltransferase family 2 protein [Patescibacteria group bacterium]|nr:glycosyltransferase family 2 protein [Patescibacteria group bacterium]